MAVAVCAEVEVQLPFKDGHNTVFDYDVETTNSSSAIHHSGKLFFEKVGDVIHISIKDFNVKSVKNVDNVDAIKALATEVKVWKFKEPFGDYIFGFEFDPTDITEMLWEAKVGDPEPKYGAGDCKWDVQKSDKQTVKKISYAGCDAKHEFVLEDKTQKVTDGKALVTLDYEEGVIKKMAYDEEVKTDKNSSTWKAKITFDKFVSK